MTAWLLVTSGLAVLTVARFRARRRRTRTIAGRLDGRRPCAVRTR